MKKLPRPRDLQGRAFQHGCKASAATACQVEDNQDWPENKNIQVVVPEISAMMAGMRQESSIGHSRTHSRIDAVAKDLKRVRRDMQLQSETLRCLDGA
jgi:hypothetical protein